MHPEKGHKILFESVTCHHKFANTNLIIANVHRHYRGQFNLKVCKTTPCMLRGSDIILQAVEQATCCNVGEVSADGLFGVDTVECQGACANAPVLVIDDDYYVSPFYSS